MPDALCQIFYGPHKNEVKCSPGKIVRILITGKWLIRSDTAMVKSEADWMHSFYTFRWVKMETKP